MPHCTNTTGVDCRGCLALNEEQEPGAQFLLAMEVHAEPCHSQRVGISFGATL